MKKCDEIKDLEKTNSPRVYDKIKELGSRKGVSRNNITKDKDNKTLVEVDDIKRRGEEYVNMIYDDNRGEILKSDGASSGPPLMQDEKRTTIIVMKKEKAAGKMKL